jgi:methylmalonyl-CoA mutase cobalamin-binding subunit
LFPKIVELLKAKGMGDVLVIGGGVIPDADIILTPVMPMLSVSPDLLVQARVP